MSSSQPSKPNIWQRITMANVGACVLFHIGALIALAYRPTIAAFLQFVICYGLACWITAFWLAGRLTR